MRAKSSAKTRGPSNRSYYDEVYYRQERHYAIQSTNSAKLSLRQLLQVDSLAGRRLLDIACGAGWLLELAEQNGLVA